MSSISLSKQTRNAASVNISAKYGLPSNTGRNVYCAYKGAFYISTKEVAINNTTGFIFDWPQQTDNLASDFNPSTVFLKIVQSSTNSSEVEDPFRFTKMSEITLTASFVQSIPSLVSFNASSIFDENSSYPAATPIDWATSLLWNVDSKRFFLKLTKPNQFGMYQILKGIYYFF